MKITVTIIALACFASSLRAVVLNEKLLAEIDRAVLDSIGETNISPDLISKKIGITSVTNESFLIDLSKQSIYRGARLLGFSGLQKLNPASACQYALQASWVIKDLEAPWYIVHIFAHALKNCSVKEFSETISSLKLNDPTEMRGLQAALKEVPVEVRSALLAQLDGASPVSRSIFIERLWFDAKLAPTGLEGVAFSNTVWNVVATLSDCEGYCALIHVDALLSATGKCSLRDAERVLCSEEIDIHRIDVLLSKHHYLVTVAGMLDLSKCKGDRAGDLTKLILKYSR